MGDVAALWEEYGNKKRDECLGKVREYQESESFCGLVFDGILCWKKTKAGTVARQECPQDFIYSTIEVRSWKWMRFDFREF